MIRLNITVEGQTEERFVKNVLAPYLAQHDVYACARAVLTSRHKRAGREYRGGFRRSAPYMTVKNDICAWMKEDQKAEARFTTMFDLYALPSDFPEHKQAGPQTDPYQRVYILEQALQKDICAQCGDSRFIPYIQLHEFEALILSDPTKLGLEYLEHDAQIARINEMVEREGGNPEAINDGESSAPSKRILSEIPEYDKVTAGPLIAGKIGMDQLRERCRHFNEWIAELIELRETQGTDL